MEESEKHLHNQNNWMALNERRKKIHLKYLKVDKHMPMYVLKKKSKKRDFVFKNQLLQLKLIGIHFFTSKSQGTNHSASHQDPLTKIS